MARKGTFNEISIRSEYLNETMEVKWYLPESFSELYKHHLCIMQDGDDYFQLGRVATLSDRLHDKNIIDNTVFVGIHYQDKEDRVRKYSPEGEQQEAYMKFLVKEVVPFLEEELPGYCIGRSRTLMGDSLAGSLALMTALKYPNTFGNVITQSPYVNDQVFDAVKSAKSLESTTIYHTIGTEETEVETTDGEIKDFYHPNLELRDMLTESGADYIFHELEGEHTWKQWQGDLKRAIETVFS